MGEVLNWDDESAAYIRARGDRYVGGSGIEPMRGRRPAPTCGSIERGPAMAKTIDPALAARLREESERTREAPYPAGARPTRPNRSKVYSIRLSEEEQAQVQQVADAKHLPASTLVRSWILDRLNQEKIA